MDYVYDNYECVVEKSRLELNERLDSRDLDIEAMRNRISVRPDVYIERKDDEFLLRFLRARKFDKERAFELLVNYSLFRRKHRPFFRSLRASCLRPVFDDGLPMVIPQRDHLGRSVILIFPGNWNTNLYTFEDILRAILLTLEYLVESERTQLCGVVLVVDFLGWRVHDFTHLNKKHFLDAIKVFQDCFPARFKGVHFVNEPWYVKFTMKMVGPALKRKTRGRIFFHGKDIFRLHRHIPATILPPELGGDLKLPDKSWLYKSLLDKELSNLQASKLQREVAPEQSQHSN